MATLDDKLLGEKLHYYCSSSEDEGGEADSGDEGDEEGDDGAPAGPSEAADAVPQGPPGPWTGTATNTGPKGVIKDWQRFKQMEAEKRAADSLEQLKLTQKLAMTCRTNQEDEKEREKERKLEEELGMLEDDEVLREFIQRRMQEMTSASQQRPQFGNLIPLETGDQFIRAVDEEMPDVCVIVHLYDDRTVSCRTMNQCLGQLSKQHPTYKFCKLRATTAGVSQRFKESGVPALLVYKAGAVIGNFVRLKDELGEDFCVGDLENFLIEHGLLEDRSCAPACVIRGQEGADEDSD